MQATNTKSKLFRYLCRGLLFTVAVAAIVYSLTDQVPIGLNYTDKTLHMLGYAGLTLMAILSWPKRLNSVAVGALLYSFLIEVFQLLHPTRQFEFGDLIANTIGFSIVLAMAHLVLALRKKVIKERALAK